ncbi:MAG: hypothetical protein IKI98_01085 [Spirochaetaceae bacterium]|nr:hypothetical protein [Spirochaetaceae bacterium]
MKKIIALLLVLFVSFFAFAQEADVVAISETEETTSVDAESDSNGTSFSLADKEMYFGVEMGRGAINNLALDSGYGIPVGVSLSGFELTPVFGMYLIPSIPDLAFEFNLMMNFVKYPYFDGTKEDGFMKGTVVAPQILAVYTFDLGLVSPFVGAGIGLNFNSGEYEMKKEKEKWVDGELVTVTETDTYDVKFGTSLGIVAKAGVKVSIPDTKVDVYGLCRYNINTTKKVEIESEELKNKSDLSSFALALGLIYKF